MVWPSNIIITPSVSSANYTFTIQYIQLIILVHYINCWGGSWKAAKYIQKRLSVKVIVSTNINFHIHLSMGAGQCSNKYKGTLYVLCTVVNIWFEEKSKHPFFIQLLCLVNKIPTKFHLEIKISLESGDENLVQESR